MHARGVRRVEVAAEVAGLGLRRCRLGYRGEVPVLIVGEVQGLTEEMYFGRVWATVSRGERRAVVGDGGRAKAPPRRTGRGLSLAEYAPEDGRYPERRMTLRGMQRASVVASR